MNKQYTVICRDKNTHIVAPQICDGESEFQAVYNFRHEHKEYDILDVHESDTTPYLFPTFRSVALFVTGLCVVSLILFPIIIFTINIIHSIWKSIFGHL